MSIYWKILCENLFKQFRIYSKYAPEMADGLRPIDGPNPYNLPFLNASCFSAAASARQRFGADLSTS